MKFHPTEIPGLILIEPAVFGDVRGYFSESYNKDVFAAHGIHSEFVQDNESLSSKGVLRGLHFQKPPYAQGKLVRVIMGEVLDIAVDIRTGSPTFGKWQSFILNSANKKMLWIPPGFAHGFLAMKDNTLFVYKCTKEYNKDSEDSIRWNDTELGINWQIENPLVSDKDQKAPYFKDLKSEFIFRTNDSL